MATVNAASNLNAEANVFSPVSKMDLLKISSEAKDLDGNETQSSLPAASPYGG